MHPGHGERYLRRGLRPAPAPWRPLITATAARMERELPAWQPFDPEEPGPGISFDLDGDDRARVLVLLAGTEASEGRWAAQASLSIARRLARTSGRTLLADLDFQAPSLHDLVGVSNEEGMSDVFLWGASFQRVAHPVEPGLLFVTAGTVVGDPGEVTASARWDSVTEGFDRAGATLTLYAPHDADGVDRLLAIASDVIVLGTREEAFDLVPTGSSDRVRAILGPAVATTPTAPPVESATPPEVPERAVSAGWANGATSPAVSGAAKGFPPYVWLTVGMLVVLAVILAAWAGWVNVPYLSPIFADRGEVVETSEGVEAVPEPPPAEAPETAETSEIPESGVAPVAGEAPTGVTDLPVQRFSFTIAAYPDPSEAADVMGELRARRPDVLFFLAPVEVGDRTFHRLLAGGAADQVGAEALRESLAETFGASNAERWIMRNAGEAYLLSRDATLAEAEARVAGLGAQGIQAYVLEVPGGDLGPYRVYAGGYSGPAESARLRGMLDAAGLTDAELVDRVGLLPR